MPTSHKTRPRATRFENRKNAGGQRMRASWPVKFSVWVEKYPNRSIRSTVRALVYTLITHRWTRNAHQPKQQRVFFRTSPKIFRNSSENLRTVPKNFEILVKIFLISVRSFKKILRKTCSKQRKSVYKRIETQKFRACGALLKETQPIS